MEFLLAQLLNGVVYGMLLFLIAAGLSLTFGLMNVVSLAHGSFFMLGAFIGLTIYRVTNNFWLAMVLAPIPVTLLGTILETGFLRPLYRRGHLDQVLLTFGFTFVFFDAVQTFWGREIYSIPVPPSLEGVIHLGAGVYPIYRLFLIALGTVLAIVLWLVLERSRLGAMVRAGVDDRAVAAGLGGNIPALFTGVFSGGVALAGLGGVVAGPILGVYAGMDADILIPAFIVIVVGGMGSLRGAFVGSLLIGEADTFGKAYLPSLALFFIYLVMVVVLLARPRGIFGLVRGPAPTVPAISPPPPAPSHHALIAGVVIAILLIGYPLVVADYPRALISEVFIFAIFAMSLDLLLGYTGLASLGHAAFFGLGSYVVIVLGAMFGLNAWIGVVLGLVAALGAGVVMGYFCVRVSGIPFLMLTLAFSQLIYSIALKWRDVTGGSDGIGIPQKPGFFGLDLSNSLTMYYMVLLFFAICFAALRQLTRSPLGLVFVGIRENEERMRAIGYATRAYKLLAFTIGAGFAGIAGGLYAIFNGFVSPDAVYWSASGDVLIMAMLGGTGTLVGPVIGAGIFLLMKNLISSYTAHWPFVIGVIFIACVLYFPAGIWGALRRLRLGEPIMTVLRIANLQRSFGSLVVTNDVSLTVEDGERHVIIGPNGAGKTSLINQIGGQLVPNGGHIFLGDAEITGWPPERIAQRGIARTFQRNNLFQNLTVAENLRLAVQIKRGNPLDCITPARRDGRVVALAEALLARVHLEGSGDHPVRNLSYGEQRQLEIGMALAGEPLLLLLDEPTSGMSPAETESMIELISALPKSIALLMIEHDMNVVFSIADRITVLSFGEVLASGSVAEVQANERVREVYLGVVD